jgi:SAM-dependent methyltransferase
MPKCTRRLTNVWSDRAAGNFGRHSISTLVLIMPADVHVYDSDRLAKCYANDRPPIHAAICARLFAELPEGYEFYSALDIGCGAGSSAAALVPHVRYVIGVDPLHRMLQHARSRLPGYTFLQGVAEALPVESAAFKLVTAAGSLSYADLNSALAEVSRVLSADGYFAAYDFCTGRVVPEDSEALSCFKSFEQYFPWPPGYSLDLGSLPYQEHGLSLVFREDFVVEIQMTAEAYVQYIMSETNVEVAVSGGISVESARDRCWGLFSPLFAKGSRTVGFRAELALATKAPAVQHSLERTRRG